MTVDTMWKRSSYSGAANCCIEVFIDAIELTLTPEPTGAPPRGVHAARVASRIRRVHDPGIAQGAQALLPVPVS